MLLTADGLRHRFVAHALSETCSLAGIVSEDKAPVIPQSVNLAQDDSAVIRSHLLQRSHAEERLLGHVEWPDVPRFAVPTGEVNSSTVYQWVLSQSPELLILYGTGIIKAPLLDGFARKAINIHLGLSPYYRGAATNFWPLVNGEPECVGATIHLAVAKVDAGSILTQVRPASAENDGAHELGTKALIAATKALPEAVALYASNALLLHEQDLTIGRVFKMSHFNAAAVRTMRDNIARGMISAYVQSAAERNQRFPIRQLAVR